ncbi:AAA domain-containing protein [Crateriforma conspicua]|uniref:DNA helicase n=1 Tax=Crateriforma conspicua TaxID=2527996 RepID=A0A5C5YBH5_9PLAN|nr:AAA domain-containing protein [Crateriforma conspicua]TWT72329.1 ATP-dependent RecD-like DNA helicase [Crateriforma conspicua]
MSSRRRPKRSKDSSKRALPDRFAEGLVDPQPATDTDFQDPQRYFDLLRRWLDLESEAERQRMARRRQMQRRADVERTGETLLAMDMSDHQIGLAGRYLLEFVKATSAPLPMNRLKVGSPVVISDDADESDEGVAGVVSRRKSHTIQVATERWPEGDRFRIDLSPDETTRRRQLAAMAKSQTAEGRAAKLRDVILGNRPLRFGQEPQVEFLTDLNPPQREAVRFALSAQDVAVIHGPPGTGKTTTVAEIIYQTVRLGGRVLACAPSNTAVDNLMEKLVDMHDAVIRVGHPARVFESLRGHTLDERVESDPSAAVIEDMRREVDQLVNAASKRPSGREGYKRRGQLFAEAGQLRGQIRALERSIVRGVLDGADVICTTTTIDDDLLGKRDFDLVVIDEACQCTETGIWQAVDRAERLVIAGDHFQLPPTVLSDQAADDGMRRSTMQRLVERDGEAIFRRLKVQYRMHQQIMRFSSDTFYDSDLVADASVKERLLADLPHVENNRWTDSPLMLIDTAGAGMDEQLEPDGLSKLNPGEANVIVFLVRQLIESGVRPSEIAIIAPYAAQVRCLRSRLDDHRIEVDTVDGFQGREKDVVLLTMVRSNETGEIGFLKDTRRTNVAMTRAKRRLVVVGDSGTLGNDAFYADMLQYFDDQSAYHSVWEFAGEMGL